VTSLLYLTPPVAAVAEWLIFGVPPTPTMWLGMAVACVGVAMVTSSRAMQPQTPIIEEPS
jgi:drug/metabolite transporter (DMT)-like permease